MTINGPGPIVPTYRPPAAGSPQAPASPAGADQAPAGAPHAPALDASPQFAPEGVNAEFWSVLTPDEQAYFVDQLKLGALTYGPSQVAPAAPAPLGTRIDVRA